MRDSELYATILGVTAPWTVGRRPGTTDALGTDGLDPRHHPRSGDDECSVRMRHDGALTRVAPARGTMR